MSNLAFGGERETPVEAVLGGRGSSSSDSDSVLVDSSAICKFNNFNSITVVFRIASLVEGALISTSERSKLFGNNARTYRMVWPAS